MRKGLIRAFHHGVNNNNVSVLLLFHRTSLQTCTLDTSVKICIIKIKVSLL